MNHKKFSQQGKSITLTMLLGLSASILVTMLGALLSASMLSGEKIGESSIGFAASAVWLIASAAGSTVIAVRSKKNRLQICLSGEVLYFGILVLINAAAFHGQYAKMGRAAISILAGTMLAAVTVNYLKNSPKKVHSKSRHR